MGLPAAAWRMMRRLTQKKGTTLADLAPLAMFGFMYLSLVDDILINTKSVASSIVQGSNTPANNQAP